jgi:hypothetical protein
VRRPNHKLLFNGQPQIWVGVNFWSRTGGPLMWRYYDPKVVREELDAMKEHGMILTRSFFYWPDFMPTPDRLDEALCEHFRDFLDAHQERGMTSIRHGAAIGICSRTSGSWRAKPGTCASSRRASGITRRWSAGS